MCSNFLIKRKYQNNRFTELAKANVSHFIFGPFPLESETNLQLFTKLLRVRNEATVSIPLVEPGAAPDLCGLLLPEDSRPYAVIELYVVSASICSYDHIFWVWLN